MCRHAVTFHQWNVVPALSRKGSHSALAPFSRRSSSASMASVLSLPS